MADRHAVWRLHTCGYILFACTGHRTSVISIMHCWSQGTRFQLLYPPFVWFVPLVLFPICTIMSEPESIFAGSWWMGSTPAGFQEGFRAVRRDVLESFAERALRWIAKKGKRSAPKDSHKSAHYSICKSKLKYCWLPRNFTCHLRLLQSSHAEKKGKNSWYWVATISRLLKFIGLFCKRAP